MADALLVTAATAVASDRVALLCAPVAVAA